MSLTLLIQLVLLAALAHWALKSVWRRVGRPMDRSGVPSVSADACAGNALTGELVDEKAAHGEVAEVAEEGPNVPIPTGRSANVSGAGRLWHCVELWQDGERWTQLQRVNRAGRPVGPVRLAQGSLSGVTSRLLGIAESSAVTADEQIPLTAWEHGPLQATEFDERGESASCH